MLGIALWIWILVFCALGCALINPILYFIKWEIYNRTRWIASIRYHRKDRRFYKEGEDGKLVRIDPIRPQIKDVWIELNNEYEGYWWIPVFNYFIFLYLFFYLVFRPTKAFWQKIVKWFGNIKV